MVRTLIGLSFLCAVALPVQAQAQDAPAANPSIELPAELERVLRDYETAWGAGDAAGLAALFSEDGFILRPGNAPTRGRAAIEQAYAGASGPLRLRALKYRVDGEVGFIVGGYRYQEEGQDMGKFVLALERNDSDRWLIAADMDNGN